MRWLIGMFVLTSHPGIEPVFLFPLSIRNHYFRPSYLSSYTKFNFLILILDRRPPTFLPFRQVMGKSHTQRQDFWSGTQPWTVFHQGTCKSSMSDAYRQSHSGIMTRSWLLSWVALVYLVLMPQTSLPFNVYTTIRITTSDVSLMILVEMIPSNCNDRPMDGGHVHPADRIFYRRYCTTLLGAASFHEYGQLHLPTFTKFSPSNQ